jgi:hypothetical protein
MTEAPASAITLRELEGRPLADPAIESMITATAHAIAERQGVPVHDLRTTADAITVTLGCGRVEAMGFAAELRRLTTAWYTKKYGTATLWGEPGDPADAWKRA